MIGVIIATHGNLARELLQTAESIVGPQEGIDLLSIDFEDDVDAIFSKYEKALRDIDAGNGVLILTDMFGGTPSNISLSYLNNKNVEVLTGVNLPMVIRVLVERSKATSSYQLASQAREEGISGIVLASEIMRQKIEEI